ncbi:MAG: hypothetical protein GY903_13630 [Fuerstiella sp.]|nr:hypothetical protein [Fuerstiella sp.]MCP4855526.1 hypothetical protein [Fuerstiella sp.]
MNVRGIQTCLLAVGCAVTAIATVLAPTTKADTPVASRLNLVFCCSADNDLYRIMTPAAKGTLDTILPRWRSTTHRQARAY